MWPLATMSANSASVHSYPDMGGPAGGPGGSGGGVGGGDGGGGLGTYRSRAQMGDVNGLALPDVEMSLKATCSPRGPAAPHSTQPGGKSSWEKAAGQPG